MSNIDRADRCTATTTLVEPAGDLQYEHETVPRRRRRRRRVPVRRRRASPWPEGKAVAQVAAAATARSSSTATGAYKGRVPSLRERFDPVERQPGARARADRRTSSCARSSSSTDRAARRGRAVLQALDRHDPRVDRSDGHGQADQPRHGRTTGASTRSSASTPHADVRGRRRATTTSRPTRATPATIRSIGCRTTAGEGWVQVTPRSTVLALARVKYFGDVDRPDHARSTATRSSRRPRPRRSPKQYLARAARRRSARRAARDPRRLSHRRPRGLGHHPGHVGVKRRRLASRSPPGRGSGSREPARSAPQTIRVAVIGGMTRDRALAGARERYEAAPATRSRSSRRAPSRVVVDAFRKGGIDLITVHASDAMVNLVADGLARDPAAVGAQRSGDRRPAADPAHIRGEHDAVVALGRIVAAQAPLLVHASLGADGVLHDLRGRVQHLVLDPGATRAVQRREPARGARARGASVARTR